MRLVRSRNGAAPRRAPRVSSNDLVRERGERGLDIVARHCRHFKEHRRFNARGELVTFVSAHLAFRSAIAHVAQNRNRRVAVFDAMDLLDDLADGVKRLARAKREHDQEAVARTLVRVTQGGELFLSRRVEKTKPELLVCNAHAFVAVKIR
eukprot:Amastigsp_a5615_29.p2 type:complete len:151 gc:universal Amastigsp_a5615_29:302-754(+)